ncbi:hypothetical protein WJX72_012099 [[Myrmecia] bisecta]|uniref:Uncharacterized protein n=1 Tax=[Myrmecia] bisecta TaxID=41462 RepID=A0AAW1PES8_9CHLO
MFKDVQREALQQLHVHTPKSVTSKDTIQVLLARVPAPNCQQPFNVALELCRVRALSISGAEARRRFPALGHEDLESLTPVQDPIPYHCGSGRPQFKLLDVLRLGHRKQQSAEAWPAAAASSRTTRAKAVAPAASSQAASECLAQGELRQLHAKGEAQDARIATLTAAVQQLKQMLDEFPDRAI